MARPGDIIYATVTLSGAPTGSVTAQLLHNGVADPTINGGAGSVTCTPGAGTNQFLATITIPSTGYNVGDTWEINATATVSAVTQSAVVKAGEIGTARILMETGKVASVISASQYTSTSSTLTATVSGAYKGSKHFFQGAAQIGGACRVVTSHTYAPASGGTPATHTFTVECPDGSTPTVGPSVNDNFISG